MHDLAARPTGAVKSAVAIAIEIMIRLNINLRIAQVRPRVEESVQRFPALTRLGRSLQPAFWLIAKLSRLRPIC
jgi:hypothetical protein